MDHLAGATTIKKLKRMLDSLPADLTQAYQGTMYRIQQQTPGRAQLAKRALAWITFAERPLSMEELRHALAVEEEADGVDIENLDSSKTILSVCLGLVACSNPNDTVVLVHSMAYNFLRAVA